MSSTLLTRKHPFLAVSEMVYRRRALRAPGLELKLHIKELRGTLHWGATGRALPFSD